MVATTVDDVFGFDSSIDNGRAHPMFPLLPAPYNLLFNYSYGSSDSVYILAVSPNEDYTMCSLRAGLNSHCSTAYHAVAETGSLTAECEQFDNHPGYGVSSPNGQWSLSWADIAREWGLALDLNGNSSSSAYSSARLLTALEPNLNHSNSSLPSIAEAFAVLASDTILISSIDAPFIYPSQNSLNSLPSSGSVYQSFNASLESVVYASGSQERWYVDVRSLF